MSMRLEFKVVSNRFPQLPAAMKRGVGRGLADARQRTLEITRSVTPRATGDLQGSEAVDSDDTNLIITAGGGEVDYALFVHGGTRFMKGRPYLRQGLEASVPTIINALAIAVESELR